MVIIKKTVILFSMAFILSLYGCSSDSSEPSATYNTEGQFFNVSVNGVDEYLGAIPVMLRPDGKDFTMLRDNYESLKLSFDQDGNLGSFCIKLRVGPGDLERVFYSYNDYSSHYFTFNLESINENTHRVKGSFSGYIYSNPFNLNSESKFVNGNFDLAYQNYVPTVAGLTNDAKINGVSWHRTNFYRNRTDELHYTQHDVNDSIYKIMVKYNPHDIAVGTYNFTPDADNNMVQLAKYNSETNTYTNYKSTGTLIITRWEKFESAYLLSGNYNFTAVNPDDPSDMIEVTDGSLKFIHKQILF